MTIKLVRYRYLYFTFRNSCGIFSRNFVTIKLERYYYLYFSIAHCLFFFFFFFFSLKLVAGFTFISLS